MTLGFPGGSAVKNPCASAGDAGDSGSIPGSRRSPGEGNGNPFQYPCLKNPMDKGAWQATVQSVSYPVLKKNKLEDRASVGEKESHK